MSINVYQCCYTNAVRDDGNTVSSGWQAVDVSPDIPSDALNACVKYQNANSSIQGNMVDELGNTLNLYELIGDGSYIYAIRTQYGLIDRLGRPNMFSHGIIYSLKDGNDVLKSPIFIALRSDNFKKSEEDASGFNSANLSYDTPLSVNEALERLGMDKAKYVTFIRCAYAQMSEKKANKALYIQYDGTEAKMRAILTCLYAALPYYLRKNISLASAPGSNDRSKNFVFSVNAKDHDFYIVPETGENSILTQRIERKIERYGYIDHAAKDLEPSAYSAFFDKLEEAAKRLGDSTASNELILKVAFQVLQTNGDFAAFSDEELESLLSDALRCIGSKSERLEALVSLMLSEINNRNYTLTEENERTLDDWLAVSKTDELKEACLDYQIHRLLELPADEAIRRLRDVPSDAFLFYRNQLSESKHGLDILEIYTANLLEDKTITWERLSRIWEESDYLPTRNTLEDKIMHKAFELYEQELSSVGNVVTAFENYSDLMKQILPERDYLRFVDDAKVEYWKGKAVGNIDFDGTQEYKLMQTKNSAKSSLFMELVNAVNGFNAHNVPEFLRRLNRAFSASYSSIYPEDQKMLAERIPEYLYKKNWVKSVSEIKPWVVMAIYADRKGALGDAINIYNGLNPVFDPNQLFNGLETFTEDCRLLTPAIALREAVADIKKSVLEACEKNDRESRPVPLDLWLYAGDGFKVFDDVDACILATEPADVVAESRLIKTSKYMNNAELYVDYKGAEAKTVKKWINEANKRPGEDKRQGKEKFLGGLFNRKK